MPSEETNSQNPIPEENSIPASPQELTADAPILPMDSEPAEVFPEALESSPNDFSVKSNDIPPSNSTLTEAENEPKTEEKQAENEPSPEPVSEPAEAPEPETAQIPVNGPLPESEPSVSEAKEEPKPIETQEPEPEKEKPRISKATEKSSSY